MNSRRIWKTGLLAIVATVAFASFVFRVQDWTKGLGSGFVVYGQTGGTTTPGAFSLTSPSNGATGVSTTTALTWGTSSGAVSYIVHIGTTNPPTTDQSVTAATLSPTLVAGATYYWSVEAVGSTGVKTANTGGVQSFTTLGLITRVLPQIAVGSFDGNLTKYSTVIQIVNTNTTAVTVSANFYKTDGTPYLATLTTNSTVSPTITTGTLASTSLAANGILTITGTPATGYSGGWGKIQSTANVTIATFFEIRDGATNGLYSRVGVNASPADMKKFVIPRVRNVASTLDVAFAIVNTGTTDATYTATLRDANGASIGTKTDSLGALKQTAKFTKEFFGLSNEPTGTSYSFITIESASAQFGAIALAFEGINQTSFPVDKLQ